MEKVAIITLFVALWINILGGYSAIAKTMPKQNNLIAEDYKIVEQALNDTDIELCALNVQGWTKLNQGKSSQKEMQNVITDIEQALDLSHQEPEKQNRYERTISTKEKGKLTLTLSNNGEGTYIDIRVQTDDQQEGVWYYQQITKLFQQYHSKDPVSFTMIGETLEPLTDKAMQYLTEDVLNTMGATLLEQTNDDQLHTYSAYSEQINDSIKVMDQKINVQIAYRQQEEQQKTKIYISTPLIFCDY